MGDEFSAPYRPSDWIEERLKDGLDDPAPAPRCLKSEGVPKSATAKPLEYFRLQDRPVKMPSASSVWSIRRGGVPSVAVTSKADQAGDRLVSSATFSLDVIESEFASLIGAESRLGTESAESAHGVEPRIVAFDMATLDRATTAGSDDYGDGDFRIAGAVSAALSAKAMARDRRNERRENYETLYKRLEFGTCVYCGEKVERSSVDHVPPLAVAAVIIYEDAFYAYSCCPSCNNILGSNLTVCLRERSEIVRRSLLRRYSRDKDEKAERIFVLQEENDQRFKCQCPRCRDFRRGCGARSAPR